MEKMLITFWGTRGSFPVQGKKYTEFGGATICVSIEMEDNNLLVIDAGTGLRDLGHFLSRKKKKPKINLFITHFHLDHLLGLPFFQPLYEADTSMTIYSPFNPSITRLLLDRFMGDFYFPVVFSETPASKKFFRLKNKIKISRIVVSFAPLPHPGGNVALRFEWGNKSIVFATDAEPRGGIWDKKVMTIAAGATYLVGEAMFTPREYAKGKKGWGHGSWRSTLKLAREAGCCNLILTHWNPDYDDKKIKTILSQIEREFYPVYGAKPGMKINL